tara:strand:- start:4 stop:393 length:390 start_codon:yes stop_codon:yes gene_type:complete
MSQPERPTIGGMQPNITSALLDPVRAVLRERYSQIEALETLDGLKDLRLIKADLGEVHDQVSYDAIASPELYEDTRNALIQAGVASEESILGSDTENKSAHGFHDFSLYIEEEHSHVIAQLRIYGPGYK